MAQHRRNTQWNLRRPWTVALAVVALLVGLVAGGAYGAGKSTSVSCTRTTTTLTCPDPQVTITATVTAPASSVPPSDTGTPTPIVPTTTDPATTPVPPPNSFPNANTTGVPTSTNLKTVAGGYSVPAGGTATGLLVQGDLIVGPNATVTNSRVTGRIRSAGSLGALSNVKISDTDIGPESCPASQSDSSVALLTGTFTLLRVHAHNWDQDLLRLTGGTGSVTDSLIDGTCYYPGDHLDAIQFYDPGVTGHWVLQHDRVEANPVNTKGKFEYGNSAVFWSDGITAASMLTIADSSFSGGNYSVVTYDGGTVKVVNNEFQAFTVQYAYCISAKVNPTYSGNHLDIGGAATGC